MIVIQTVKKWNVGIYHTRSNHILVTYMDATNMEHIPDDCFDIIVDKALLDTLLCHENNLHKVEDYLVEIHRVLKGTGVMIVISHGLPINRLDYFDPERWVVDPIAIRK